MTFDEAKNRLAAVDSDIPGRCEADGSDLRIERSISWSWKALQAVAAALGTGAIDLADRDPYDTIPGSTGRYEHEYGCYTCGYGSVLVVRGVLA